MRSVRLALALLALSACGRTGTPNLQRRASDTAAPDTNIAPRPLGILAAGDSLATYTMQSVKVIGTARDTTRVYQWTRVTVQQGVDSVVVRAVVLPTPAPVVLHRFPFGPMGLMKGCRSRYGRGYAPFTLAMHGMEPAALGCVIDSAKAAGLQLIIEPAGGAHSNYIDSTTGRFSLPLWTARIRRFDTLGLRAKVAQCVAEKVCIGASLLDEPNHPSWGPSGTLTKGTLDTMASRVKAIFPTLPAGAIIVHDWRPSERYQVLDFIISQFSPKFGSRPGWGSDTLWLRSAKAAAAANKVALLVSANTTDWSNARSGTVPCPVPATGGTGSAGGDVGVKGCRISAPEYAAFGALVARDSGVQGFTAWYYDTLTYDRPEIQAAARAVRSVADNHPPVSLRRRN